VTGFLAALEAARSAPLGPDDDALPAEDAAAFDALACDAAPTPGVITDWFGLRTPLDLAPELAAFAGQRLPRAPRDPRGQAADWIALAHSVAAAEAAWSGLSIGGTGRGDLLLAGAVAAHRRGLAPRLRTTEPDAGRREALLRLAEANAIAADAIGMLPPRLAPPPGSAEIATLLGAEPRWDWLRLGQPGLFVSVLVHLLPVLTERVRVLALVTRHRAEEARAVTLLAEAGWRLLAEAPARLSRADPRKCDKPGVQAWRSPA
jgi:hypothetical protein